MNFHFTDGSRRALARAREEAIHLGHDYVGTEHILLGILGDQEIFRLIERCGVTPEAVRDQVLARVKEGRSTRRVGELPYTSRAKKVLEHAMAEARRLKSDHLGTEHLLLGTAREEKGIGAEALHSLGITLERLRSEVSTYAGAAASEEVRRRGIFRRARSFRVQIDDASDQSIYEQIVAQVTEAVATGELRPGERLQTVRQMADDLDVAPGTVARAYSELERQGVVVTEGARGTRVADRRDPQSRSLVDPESLAGLLRPVAVAAFHLGATADDLRQALERAMRGIFDKREDAA